MPASQMRSSQGITTYPYLPEWQLPKHYERDDDNDDNKDEKVEGGDIFVKEDG